jgi:uncharacterized protein YfdQ (DUF2303 family)
MTKDHVVEGEQDLAAVLRAGAALVGVQKSPIEEGRPFVLAPEGYAVKYITERDDVPHRAKGVVKLRDVESFIAYFNRQKRANSQIYATLDPAKILGVIDDHHEHDEKTAADHDGADFREYRVEFAVPTSREWKLWTGKDKVPMTQLDFARLIEDNLPDIIKPSGSDMLKVALDFEASRDGVFAASGRLDNGSQSIVWKENVEAKGNKIEMPQTMTLYIPVFENSSPVEIEARIRYRVKDAQLSIWIELIRAHKVAEAAFRDIWTRIEAETSRQILLGTPE